MLRNAGHAPVSRSWLRVAVFALGGLQTAAILGLLGLLASSGQLASGEALSRSMAWAIVAIYGGPYLLLVVPALVLALVNRHLAFALTLCLVSLPVGIFLFRAA